MSHYECHHCGEHMGINYGSCTRCTPPEVLRLDKELKAATLSAQEEFDNSVYEIRRDFVRNRTAEAKAEYETAYEAGKTWFWKKNSAK